MPTLIVPTISGVKLSMQRIDEILALLPGTLSSSTSSFKFPSNPIPIPAPISTLTYSNSIQPPAPFHFSSASNSARPDTLEIILSSPEWYAAEGDDDITKYHSVQTSDSRKKMLAQWLVL